MQLLLLPQDKQSDVMRKLVAYWRDEQQRLRERNDNKGTDPIETAFIRGRLAQLKEDIALGAEPPTVRAREAGYADDAPL